MKTKYAILSIPYKRKKLDNEFEHTPQGGYINEYVL